MTEPSEDVRLQARKRLEKKRDFAAHVMAYVVVNGALVLIWALSGGGYFWPAWVIGLWGVGLIMNAWDVFWRRGITEADIDREVMRGERGR